MSENTKYGTYALNTGKGFQNTAIGYGSSANTTTDASSNTSVGAWSLTKTTTGDNNVAVGCNSLLENTTGRNNVGVGPATLLETTTANNNTAVGANSLQYNTTGSNNVAIGAKSGFNMTTQSNVICIGADSEPIFTDSSGNYTDNQTVIGNADITNTYIYGTLTISGGIAGITGGIITGPTGPQGPTGPTGTVGVNGSSYGDYLYWNSSAWTVGSSKISLGRNAGQTSQGAQSVAIGYNAGSSNQLTNSVAIGSSAGSSSQFDQAVAIGIYAGQFRQGYTTGTTAGGSSVAIGANAGRSNQQPSATAIGVQAGTSNQGSGAVAIGVNSGFTGQGINATSVGNLAGNANQGASAVAIGVYAGQTGQGSNAIAIGNSAGRSNQPSNSIVLNASGTVLNGSAGNAFYVNPVRGATGPHSLYYDTTTKEVTYAAASSSTNYWTQANDGSISANNVTISLNTGAIGTNAVDYDYALNSSNQLQYISYFDTSNKVWFYNDITISEGGIQPSLTPSNIYTSTIRINDIGMSKLPDSSGNLTIACAQEAAAISDDNYNVWVNSDVDKSNVIISRDNGKTWVYYRVNWKSCPATSIAVSPDGTHVVVGGSNNVDGFITTFNFTNGAWGYTLTWNTDQNIYWTAVGINNAYSLNIFRNAQANANQKDLRLRDFTTASTGGINMNTFTSSNKTTQYGSTVAISKNGMPVNSMTDASGNLWSIKDHYLCVSVLDWAANTEQSNTPINALSIAVGFVGTDIYGTHSTGIGSAIEINGVMQSYTNTGNKYWKCYGVDVSPDGNIILVTAGYDSTNTIGTIPAPYILVSYDYGAHFNTLLYDTSKDFGRIKVTPNPNTGAYDGSGSFLVYNNVDDKIYYYNDYTNLYNSSKYNMSVTSDINCDNLYANSKVYAAGVALTSDYRIKDNVQTLDSSVVDLSKINPVSYYNKLSKQDEYGFIAHELQESLPLLVNGEKDGESYQSVNYVGLIPILVKEIQTLRQEVNELKNKV
jgi:hypothetical protein